MRAYEIESQEAIYPRIAVDEDAIAEHRRDPRLRGEHHTAEDEHPLIDEMLAVGEDGTRYIDYLRASRGEFRDIKDWLDFLSRHASLVRDGLEKSNTLRVTRKFEWLARYHDRCVAELQEEISSSDAIADELYEEGIELVLPSFVTKLFIHSRRAGELKRNDGVV